MLLFLYLCQSLYLRFMDLPFYLLQKGMNTFYITTPSAQRQELALSRTR